MKTPLCLAEPAPRLVLFMTTPSAADIPCGANSLACLLPLGTSTFAERLMDSCAQAGLREIDLVVSEDPESLRERLGDGSQWGLRLAWRHAKDTATPYTVLRGIGLARGERVLLGHGHRWVAHSLLRALMQEASVAICMGEPISWTGWFSMNSESIQNLAAHADFDALSAVALSEHPDRRQLIATQQEYVHADSALELLQAQDLVLRDATGHATPASWLRMPWGAMSPRAIVHPQAQITGPVLVGEGCTVGRNAQIGPGAVLSRNVLVAEGAVVRQCLVLPNTYVGGSVTLEHAVVQGNTVQNLKWSVRMTLSRADALLTPLLDVTTVRTSWPGRLFALLLALMAAPFLLGLMAVQALRGRPWRWQRLSAVTGRAQDSGQLCHCNVRQHRAHAGKADWLLGCGGRLLDVVQGRRNWFGVRPRDASQWHALGRDWQILFGRTALGFFHAPAWADPARGINSNESQAVADAYFAISNSPRERFRILCSLVKGAPPRQENVAHQP